MYNNFEISLVVFMTNITTNHAITYTNLFTYEALKILKNSLKRVRAFQIELEIGRVGFRGEEKTGVPGEKHFGAKERTNSKLNIHMVLTQATLVGGECSHHARR